MNPNTPMKTPDYKHLAKIGAEAAKCCIHWSEINETFARAVIEEYERLRMEQVGEGMPSVEECIRVWHRSGGINQGPEAVCNLMLAAFEKKLEEFAALEERHRETTTLLQECVQKFNLGLGGERIDKLVVEALTESTAKLAAAEKRLGEIAKLPEKWRFYVSADACTFELEAILKASTSAEEVSRAEFELEMPCVDSEFQWNYTKTAAGEYVDSDTRRAFKIWQAARASKEVKAPAE